MQNNKQPGSPFYGITHYAVIIPFTRPLKRISPGSGSALGLPLSGGSHPDAGSPENYNSGWTLD